MKNGWKSISIFFLALLTALAVIIGIEHYLDVQIERLYDVDKYTYAINASYGDLTKDKGRIILEKSMENHNLMLLGSSELGSWVGQNPIHMFPNTTCDENVTIVGQAYVQSLLHAMKAGMEIFENQDRLGIVVSLQWFFDTDIDKNGFAANFSEYQFYQMMSNENLSKESKRYVCSRTYELLYEIQGYDDIKVYAWLYSRDSLPGRAALAALSPYYFIRMRVLEIRDKWDTYSLLKRLQPEAQPQETKEIAWEEAMAAAQAEGESCCNNNEFFVENNYYDTYLRGVIEEGSLSEEMLVSREMEDYEMFLRICKENGVKPYIIIMNTNGRYYDFIGLDEQRRSLLYGQLEEKAKEYGFDCLNLSDKEYEPYFMVDVMHLGWRGWLYVDQQLAEYFAESSSK